MQKNTSFCANFIQDKDAKFFDNLSFVEGTIKQQNRTIFMCILWTTV